MELLWTTIQNMGIPTHLVVLIRSLYIGQKATVQLAIGVTPCFGIGKGVRQWCLLSTYLFNLYGEAMMKMALDQASGCRLKVAGLTLDNLRYADDTTLVAGSISELILAVKEVSVKFGLHINIKGAFSF
jgi:hypothetical protein